MINCEVKLDLNVIDTMFESLDKNLDRAAQFVENDAKVRAPHDSGNLRRSIHHTDVVNHAVTIGTDVDYAVPVHEGHGSYGGVKFLEDSVMQNTQTILDYIGGKR